MGNTKNLSLNTFVPLSPAQQMPKKERGRHRCFTDSIALGRRKIQPHSASIPVPTAVRWLQAPEPLFLTHHGLGKTNAPVGYGV